jgi:gliding motility-associated-like protein
LPAFKNEGLGITGFIKNKGQVNAMEGGIATNVLFSFQSKTTSFYITDKGISYVFSKLLYIDSVPSNPIKGYTSLNNRSHYTKRTHVAIERVDAILSGAILDTNRVSVEYCNNSPRFNYYSGTIYAEGQQLIRKITFSDVYPGIDWLVYDASDQNQQLVKYDFIVHPGANAANITIHYSPNASLNLNTNGGISIKSKLGFIREGRPVGYAMDRQQNKIKLLYQANKNNSIHFNISALGNQKKSFIIDPDLYWGTYLHTISPVSTGYSQIMTTDITSDKDANIYVAAYCIGAFQFPTVNQGSGAYYNDVYDSINGSNLYLKFTQTGILVWATYFSSGAYVNSTNGTTEQGFVHITTDSKGNLITSSMFTYGQPLPYTNNGGYFDSTSLSNCYLAKFDPNGILTWCTKWSNELQFHKIVHDAEDNFYIGGTTTGNPYPIKDPGNGAWVHTGYPLFGIFPFISKFDKNCNLIWSTDIPGSDDPEPTRIAVDKFKSIYVYKIFTRYTYPIVDGGGFMNTTGDQTLTKFDSTYKMVWSTRLPSVYGGDITTDTSGNVYVVGSSYGGTQFPYTDPGNGAFQDPNPANTANGGSILKFDAHTNLVWATTYCGNKNFFFTKAIHEPYRNLIHIYGIMNCSPVGIPTQNDACNGSYYYSSIGIYTYTDPIITSFTTSGKLLYASFNNFPYADYNVSEMAADPKGNLLFEFGSIINTNPFPSLRNPGNGAFYQDISMQYSPYTSFLMKLTPTILDVNTSFTSPKKCDSSGTITATTSCGNGSYQYLWNRGDTTPTISGVSAGKYTVKVTDKNTGLSKTISVTIPNPPGNIQSAVITSIQSFCNQHNGKIWVDNVNGGPTPYTFALNNQLFSNSPLYDSLPAGNYQIAVKDSEGCAYKDSLVIINKPGPKHAITSISASACNQSTGQIQIDSIQSGTAPYTYTLNGKPISTTRLSGLSPETYLLGVTDSAGCTLTDTISVKRIQGPDAVVPVLNDSVCGQITGGVTVTKVSGGTLPYLYSLDSLHFTADSSFQQLKAGLQYLYVQDANGCTYKDSVQLSYKAYPIVSIPADTIMCNHSTLLLNVSQPGASYLWQDGSTTADKLIDSAGKYNVSVTINGCTTTDTSSVSYQQTPNVTLPVEISKCVEDTLHWDISFPGAKYLWQDGSDSPIYTVVNAAIYRYIVTDYCGSISGIVNVETHICYCDLSAIPNAFSPNGDGINDEFKPVLGCTTSYYHLLIFDRGGQLVFETYDPVESWKGLVHGKPVPVGTYYYILKVKGESDQTVREKSGGITVLR